MTEANESRHGRSVSSGERLSALQQANDHVEYLLSQLLLAEEAAKNDVVRSAEKEERHQAIEQGLGPVYDPDLEPTSINGLEPVDEPEPGSEPVDEPEPGSEPVDEPGSEPLDEPASVDEFEVPMEVESIDELLPLDEPAPVDEPLPPEEPLASHAPSTLRVSTPKDQNIAAAIPELNMTDLDDDSLDEPLDPDARFFKPEVKLTPHHDEVLATKSHPDRLEVGMSVMDDATSGRTRELRTRKREPQREGFFGTIGAFVAKVLRMD